MTTYTLTWGSANMRRLAFAILASIVMVVIVCEPVAHAIEISKKGDMIVFSDKNASGCSPSGESGVTGNLPGGENVEKVLRFFTGRGLSLAAAAGFAGNMTKESGLRADIIEGGATAPSNYSPVNGVGFGLVQWTFTPRQAPLVVLARSTGRSVTDITLQLDYIWQELNTGYKATLQALAAPDMTPEKAAVIIHGRTPAVSGDPRFAIAPALGYEASGDNAQQVYSGRVAPANAAYQKFKGAIQDGAGVSGIGSTSALSAGAGCAPLASGDCSATKPIMGAGGNGIQINAQQLQAMYGPPGPGMRTNLVETTFMGQPVTMHKKVIGCLKAVENEIKSKNINYTVKQTASYRVTDGQVGNSGYHVYGAAIDLNWGSDIYTGPNPYVPDGSARPYDIPQGYIEAFRNHGWSWGGDWKAPKDYMHFEYNGEKPEGN